jgi:PAS domain S-box-containing protein
LSTSEARHKVLNEEVHRFRLRHEDLTSSKKESLRQYANMELALGIVLCFASIFFFGGMVRRILNVAYNAERFAKQVPLLPTIAGSDEIASLDESFHLMAAQLEESMRKERAVIANAVDVICSLNSQLEIAAINPAVVKLLGYSQEELLNHSFKELVFDDDLALVVRYFCDLKAIESELEIRVRRKDGEVRDFLWSTRWVESEKLIFCIGHDVTEKRNAERMKQDVMNMVSHDLRTPLTTIMNSLAMFSDGMFGEMEPKAARVLQRAESCVDRMMHLTKDLLDIEKIRSGTLILEKADFPVARAFQKAATSVSAMAAMKNITVDILEEQGNVFGDEERVVQVLVNLLSNAIKFSQNGGRIEVFASLNEKQAKISVRDYGRGIPAEKVCAIFSKFEQVRASDASKEGGTGLGLAICKSLVELHEGKIFVESVLGEGSTFSFELPAFGEV